MAHAEYFNAQQKLQNIFANCQDWNGHHFRLALNDLLDSTVQMVRAKNQTIARHPISDSSDTPQPAAARAAPPLRPRTPLGPPPVAIVMPNQTGGLRPTTLTYGRISWHTYSKHYMKKRAIGAAKFNAKCTKQCAICLDTHTNGESVVTEECQHCFGKQCWQTWMSHSTGNQSCPECRTHRPKTIFYSLRADRKTKYSALVAEAHAAGSD